MTAPNPYAADLGDRDPLDALADTPGRIRDLVACWTPEQFARSYAPGKWPMRTILVHLAQTELALGTRVRFALSTEHYVAQGFSQDAWISLDEALDPRTALEVYLALRSMNVPLFRALTPAQRARPFTHPEYGDLTVWWVAEQLAGHDIHHFKQLGV